MTAPPADTLEDDRRRARLAAASVAGAFDIAPETLMRGTRGAAGEAATRQILCLVWLRMGDDAASAASVARLGRVIGRDRATTMHALRKMEKVCEADPDLDLFIATLTRAALLLWSVSAPTLATIASAIAAAQAEEAALAVEALMPAKPAPAPLGTKRLRHGAAVEALVVAAQARRGAG